MKNYNLKNAFKLQRIPKLLLLFMSVLFLSACVEGTTTSPSPNPPVFTGGGTANATINVAANSTATGYTAAATDSDGDSLTYSLSGGADQALFIIDANSGELSFLVMPDFDAPTDSDNNNSYEVEISVSDGSNTTVQRVTIIVSNDNENSAPVFTSGTSLSVFENTTITGYTATATDGDGDTLAFSVSGGADQSTFSIDETTGVLNFLTAPDYDSPSDSDNNNSYEVEITVSDGNHVTVQSVTILVSLVLLPDNIPPVVTLSGSNLVNHFQGDTYTEAGANAFDDRDGSIDVTISGAVNNNTLGSYVLTYTATDTAGNIGTATRTVNVVLTPDAIAPVVTLNGENPISIFQFSTYTEAGASATDNRDGSVDVTISGAVDNNTLGSYVLTYSATDIAGNIGSAIRTVNVVLPPDTTLPVVTLIGNNSVNLFQFDTYTEVGASAFDDRDGSIDVTITGAVDTSNIATYVLTYTATDTAGNTGTATRTVNVVLDTIAPVVTLNGENPITIFQIATYAEAGASATDNRDSSVDITITGAVDTSNIATYVLTYTATDTAGNTGTATRTVNVVLDTIAPVVTLNGENPITIFQFATYTEAGASATDNRDGSVGVTISGTVNNTTLGSYVLTYSATDIAGNTGSATRTIDVVLPPDTVAPIVTLNGDNPISVFQLDLYVEAGASATDDRDGIVDVMIAGIVDTSSIGSYIVTYSASDAAGNTSTATRTVNVISNDFITTWKTDNPGFTENSQIKITTSGSGYNYSINWGDGQTDLNVTGDITHTYATAGTYTVLISGDFPRIIFDNNSDAKKLLSVERWGDIQWQSMNSAFAYCTNLVVNAIDAPDLTLVTDMSFMFRNATAFNQNINSWDVSSATNMGAMFMDANSFDQPLSEWDVSSVTNMASMFFNARAFNQPLNDWDVSSVTNMASMFRQFNFSVSSFNQPLNDWDVSSVTNITAMFWNANHFDQDISTWNVSSVTGMSYMFFGARAFNQPLNDWDVSSVTSMRNMFQGAHRFNQPLNTWIVSSVTKMEGMFFNAYTFNQDLSSWDVSSVRSMPHMFRSARAFNHPLNGWTVSSVTNMTGMFMEAYAFNQPLGSWNVSSVMHMGAMFRGADSFDQPLGSWDVSSVTLMWQMFSEVTLSPANYDALLLGWSAQGLQNNVTFDGGNSLYSGTSQDARDILTVGFGWTVTDDGVVP